MTDKLAKSENKLDKIVPAKFKPRARLLLQLGDQLIKNESIALIELVKNSYDADANNVEIYMEQIDDPQAGRIVIEDNGFGMDLDTVENVWLEPGSDYKSKQIQSLKVSPKYNRLPIGEKGIGRFGVHKLGNEIEMTTKKSGSNEVFVKIDWGKFADYKYLDDVPIEIVERSTPKLFKNGKTGTSISISNLREKWERAVARTVKRSVNALVSPFDSVDDFKADFKILDKPEWFKGLLEWKDIKAFSLFHFKVVLSENEIKSFEYEFTPWASMPNLSGRKVDINSELVKNFVALEGEMEGKDGKAKTTKISLSNNKNGDPISIGEVVFEGYVFDRDSFVLKLGVTDKTGFKAYLSNNGGVRVFREGLRVYDYGEPENDWLGLDYRRFNQPGKKISNNLILGAIYLKRKDSVSLVEKTNREGFVENEAYLIFKESILHTINIIETLRYSDKQKLREAYGPTPKSEPVIHVLGELKKYVDVEIKDNKVKEEISKYLGKIESDYKRINETLLKAAGAGLSMSVVIHEVEKIIYEIKKVLEAEKASERVINLVKHLSSLIDGYAEIISKSAQTSHDLKDIIEQALFNAEYRLSSHKIKVIKDYKAFQGQTKIKIARNLLIGSLMNIIDNSIFWLEKAHSMNENLHKKIYIKIDEEKDFLNLLIADNGTGFLLPTEDITEPFVSAKPGGMGLGLHIASEVMLAQGGTLTFPQLGDFDIPAEFEQGAAVAFRLKK
jgi:signal transduction histidine kinase